jgi:hypothetical protein
MNGNEVRRHDLLPGRTAIAISNNALAFIILLGIDCLLLMLSIPVRESLPHAVGLSIFNVLFGVLFISVGLCSGFSLAARSKERQEVASGYTTVLARNVNVDQVDPITGIVIRDAGASYLTRAELNAARDRARRSAGLPFP